MPVLPQEGQRYQFDVYFGDIFHIFSAICLMQQRDMWLK